MGQNPYGKQPRCGQQANKPPNQSAARLNMQAAIISQPASHSFCPQRCLLYWCSANGLA